MRGQTGCGRRHVGYLLSSKALKTPPAATLARSAEYESDGQEGARTSQSCVQGTGKVISMRVKNLLTHVMGVYQRGSDHIPDDLIVSLTEHMQVYNLIKHTP